MKRRSFIQMAGAAGLAGVSSSCANRAAKARFSFVHFSDVHIEPERGAKEGFLAAIAKMNSLRPDFAISGGDLIMDALGADETRAVTLYDLYIECCKSFDMPLHNTIGNHEIFGIYDPDKVPENHPLWGKEMFKKRLGNGSTYRSFDHNGVHFVLLDSMGYEKRTDKPGYEYFGQIGAEQMSWLEKDLSGIPAGTPVIAVSHIPFFTYYSQITDGPLRPNSRGGVITDGKELYDLLTRHRLIGYLEGHIHVNEIYTYKGARFVDTGAVCGAWWQGPRDGHPEGFNLVHVYDDRIETEYMTYGWDASKYKPVTLNRELFPFAQMT
ncbi:metallophosphoesterase [bacterium]|nr:metallophosphoesterase [bacterium]